MQSKHWVIVQQWILKLRFKFLYCIRIGYWYLKCICKKRANFRQKMTTNITISGVILVENSPDLAGNCYVSSNSILYFLDVMVSCFSTQQFYYTVLKILVLRSSYRTTTISSKNLLTLNHVQKAQVSQVRLVALQVSYDQGRQMTQSNLTM